MFSKLLLAAALVGVANAQTCGNADGSGGGALTCLANSVADAGATGTSCTGACTQAKDNDKCCTPNTGYSSDATADNNAITANSCTGGTLTQPSNGVEAGTVADPIVTGTDVSANIVGATGYTCTGTALAVCTTTGANAVTTTGRTCVENTCTAKANAAAWAALGVTVTTATATTVTGLGTIAKASNYFGTLSVTCPTDGGEFDVSGVTACTTVANAADPTAVTCTDATDSQMTGACATGYTKNTAATADACDANSCTGGTLTQPSNGVEAGTVADPIVTGTDVTANIVGAAGYTCTGTALAVCTTTGANAVTTTGRTCTVTPTTTAAPTTTPEPEPETPAPAPATLPDNSASTEITSVIAVVTVIAAALAGL